MLSQQIPQIQEALGESDVDGWLFACFQHNDPISQQFLGLSERMVTRRCYYLVPQSGEPRKLVHTLEPAMLDHLPGNKLTYLTWGQHRSLVSELLQACSRVAAQYSPLNDLPTVSRLDAGTAELLRGAGVELVSSGDLVQRFAATWTEEQLTGHRLACRHLHDIARAAFGQVTDALRAKRPIGEHEVQSFILESFDQAELWSEDAPIVAVGPNSADPHYQPGPGRSASIRQDQLLLIDLWAKQKTPHSVYAGITWCGVCSAAPTERQHEIFTTVTRARDAALAWVQERYPGEVVRGFEVDDAARGTIDAAGYGDHFIHRTGHSIGTSDHGPGANMDNLETHDTRRLLAMTAFSIEPGIYLPGEFGVRSEINVALTPTEAEVTGGEPQRELVALLS